MILVVLTACASTTKETGDVIPGYAGAKTGEGILIGSNMYDVYLLIELIGKEIKPIDHPEVIMFTIDDRVIQIVIMPITRFYKGELSQVSNEFIYKEHYKWEKEYIEKKLRSKVLSKQMSARIVYVN